MTKLNILYQIPSLETVYAGKFIYEGYKAAFLDMGHNFRPVTANDNPAELFEDFKPNILISSLNGYNLRFLDLKLVNKYRRKGLVLFNQISPWKKTNEQYSSGNLGSDSKLISLIKSGLAGDIFFTWIEQGDPLMEGFTKTTGYKYETILMAANKMVYFNDYDEKYKADVSYVGNNLPDKKEFFQKHLIPLFRKYKVKVYGNDWTQIDKAKGYIQKVGQYFNIEPLKHVRKVALDEDGGRKVYSSSTISLNIHEEHQRRLGCDFNERTFKIIASGGFEICDNVKVLRKYFTNKELVIGEDTNDWFDKIEYYIKNPEKRVPIIEAGKKKVLKEHTYHNRANQFIDLYNNFRKGKLN